MVSYTLAENAFVINYADYCIANNLNYNASVASAFQAKFKRATTWEKLRHQAPHVLKTIFKVRKPSLAVFKKEGTGCIDRDIIAGLQGTLLSTLNSQRKQMHLRKLEARTDTKDSEDDQEGRNNEEEDEQDIDDDSSVSSAPTMSEAADVTETIDGGDLSPSKRPVRIEETPEATYSHETTAAGDASAAGSIPVAENALTTDTEMTDVATETIVRDTATAAAVIHATTPPNHRPTPSPISPSVMIPRPSAKALGKRKATEVLVNDTSSSKRLDCGRPGNSLDRRSGVETTGDANLPFNKEPNLGSAANEARIALQLACGLYRLILDIGKDVPHDFISTVMQKVQRSPEFTEDAMIGMVLKEAESQRKLKENSEDMVANLVGELEYNTKTVFPKTPSHEDVDREWRNFQQHIMYTVGHNSDTPTPHLGAAGYLSRTVEAIANSRISENELNDEIRELHECLASPHAHQTLLSALFCRWVFNSPEAVSKEYHHPPVMKILEAAKWSGGLQQVQHIDKLMTQQMFVDPDHRSTIARRERVLCQDFSKVAQALCKPHEIQPSPIEPLASAAIVLKHSLMLSPDDYRIHYCRPETLFDSTWMQAVDAKNFPIADAMAMGKETTLCMFPALFSQKSQAFGKDAKIEDALVMNKRFFPTSDEKRLLDLSLCLSKATVLVLL